MLTPLTLTKVTAVGASNAKGNPVPLSMKVCEPPSSSKYTLFPEVTNGPNISPTVSTPNCRLASTSLVERTAVVPDAVTEDVAPAVPTPPKMRSAAVVVKEAV